LVYPLTQWILPLVVLLRPSAEKYISPPNYNDLVPNVDISFFQQSIEGPLLMHCLVGPHDRIHTFHPVDSDLEASVYKAFYFLSECWEWVWSRWVANHILADMAHTREEEKEMAHKFEVEKED